MSENPFESPILDTTGYVKTLPSGPVKRPIGVSILVVLLAIAVLVCFVIGVIILVSVLQGNGLEILSLAMSGIMFLLGGLGLAMVIGMWTGAKWGWWLGTLGYAISAVVNGVSLLMLATMVQQHFAAGNLYIMHGTRAFIAVLIVAYLFKDNVLRFFGLQDWAKGKLFGVLAGITLGCCVVLAIIGGVVQVLMFGVASE